MASASNREPVLASTVRRLTTAVIAVLLLGAAALGFQVLRKGVESQVYQQRLRDLSREHQALAEQYNLAVTRAAVTELLIADGKVSVNVRTPDGRMETHPVAADPAHPLYVDYVVKDSRLLIRRVFDSQSVPDQAGVLNSDLLNLDWNDPTLRHGQAIYRQMTDGRWIVTVSGDGSLALAKVDDSTDVQLMPAPRIEEFDPVEQTQAEVDGISPVEVLRRWLGA